MALPTRLISTCVKRRPSPWPGGRPGASSSSGTHGKSAAFVGFDEIHAYQDWSLLEALQPDPTRADVMTWITSYASLFNTKGAPLHDLMQIGKAAADPRMLFSWYSGEYCTDPAFADLPPEQRANPSMPSWYDTTYLDQQRARLPTGRFRRLHLNLPGSPEGSALDQDNVLACVVKGRKSLPWADGVRYFAAVDMSGGSSDDACLAIAHQDATTKRIVVDLVAKQSGSVPFSPRAAIKQFCDILQSYRINKVYGDAFAGQTFRHDFEEHQVQYEMRSASASDLYERLEPPINAGEVELPDHPTLVEQIVSLVWRGNKITHEPGSHDDHANAVALVVNMLREEATATTGSWAIPGVVTAPRQYFGDTTPAYDPRLGSRALVIAIPPGERSIHTNMPKNTGNALW
jgi:hypothetical protein